MADPITTIESTTNFWDFLSTAATVGLPAYITYRVTRHNNKIELQKEKERHENELQKISKNHGNEKEKNRIDIKMKILGEATALIQEYFNAQYQITNIWFNFKDYEIQYYLRDIQQYNHVIDNMEFNQRQTIYSKGYSLCEEGISQLKMLNLSECAEKISLLKEIVSSKNNSILNNTCQFPSNKEFEETLYNINKLREEYYSLINKYIENI